MTGRARGPAGSAAAASAMGRVYPARAVASGARGAGGRHRNICRPRRWLEALRGALVRKQRSRFTGPAPWRGSRLLRGNDPFRVWKTRGYPRALSRKPRCVPVRSWPRRLRRRTDPSHGGLAVRSFSGDSIQCGTSSGSPAIPAEVRATDLRRQYARQTVARMIVALHPFIRRQTASLIADCAFGNAFRNIVFGLLLRQARAPAFGDVASGQFPSVACDGRQLTGRFVPFSGGPGARSGSSGRGGTSTIAVPDSPRLLRSAGKRSGCPAVRKVPGEPAESVVAAAAIGKKPPIPAYPRRSSSENRCFSTFPDREVAAVGAGFASRRTVRNPLRQ